MDYFFEDGIILGTISYYFTFALMAFILYKIVKGTKGIVVAFIFDLLFSISATKECYEEGGTAETIIVALPWIFVVIIIILSIIVAIITEILKGKILKNLYLDVQKYISEKGYSSLDKFEEYIKTSAEYSRKRDIVESPMLVEKAVSHYRPLLVDYETKRVPKLIDDYIENHSCRPIEDFEEYCRSSAEFEAARSLKTDDFDLVAQAVSNYSVKFNNVRSVLLKDIDLILKTYIKKNNYQPLWCFEKYCKDSPEFANHRKYLYDFYDILLPQYEDELRSYELAKLDVIIDQYIDQNGYKSLHRFNAYCKTEASFEAASSISYETNGQTESFEEYAERAYFNKVNSHYMRDLERYLSKTSLKNFTIESVYMDMPKYSDFFRSRDESLDQVMLEGYSKPVLNKMIEQGLLKIAVGSGFDALYELIDPLADMVISTSENSEAQVIRQGNMVEIIKYVDDDDEDF